MITFAVSDVPVARDRKAPLDRQATLAKLLHQPVEALSEGAGRLVHASDANAFAEAVQIAFIEHRPLVLSPDAVWLCLANGFALHVNEHHAALRERFVRHEGRLELVVNRPDFELGRPNPWPEVFAAFGGAIAAHVGKLRDLVVADFSTTGPVERAASEIALMDGFQAYFEYVMRIGCGIPSITLLGTPDDWRSIRARAAVFAEYSLEAWTRPLARVLDELVRAAEGRPDPAFFRSFFRYESGSGHADLTGFIHLFFPYLRDHDGKLHPNPHMASWEEDWAAADAGRRRWDGPLLSELPPALASAPVRLIDERTGKEHPFRFVAGLFGVVEDEATGAVSPEVGWAVVHGHDAGAKWAPAYDPLDDDGDFDPVTGLSRSRS